jgi:SpoVK/Ycf46/Vps4 family AAA+-type ATPase
MEQLKAALRDTVGLILAHRDAAETYGIRWSGLPLHGPPGTGKTFIGRAAAGELGLNLLHVSTGDLVDGVMGQSAQNAEALFATAAANRPCLVLFDEFVSLAQRRAEADREERRAVNQLLTSIEEHRDLHDLVVVAATNDIDDLRRGRLVPLRPTRPCVVAQVVRAVAGVGVVVGEGRARQQGDQQAEDDGCAAQAAW